MLIILSFRSDWLRMIRVAAPDISIQHMFVFFYLLETTPCSTYLFILFRIIYNDHSILVLDKALYIDYVLVNMNV